MRFLFLITARGGSKGIPRKNMKLLGGKPLIYYTIKCAMKIANPKDICVSSDDDEIINYARKCGLIIPFKRPAELSGDSISQDSVILHAIDYYIKQNQLFDAVVLLQPTSPFRSAEHLREALSLYNNSIDMIVSVKKTDANPYFVLFEENEDGFLKKSKVGNYIRRQDCPDVWQYNGSIYIINIKALKESLTIRELKYVKKYVMPDIFSIDIDSPLDWDFCEFLFEKYNQLFL